MDVSPNKVHQCCLVAADVAAAADSHLAALGFSNTPRKSIFSLCSLLHGAAISIDFSMADSLEQSAELAWPEFIKTRVLNTITSSSVSDRLDFINHALLIRLRRKGTLSYSSIFKV